MTSFQIGTFAYRIKRGKVEIMLVTTRSSKRWILPKGKPEEHLSQREVAIMEAYEEAGVLGSPVNGRFYDVSLQRAGGCITQRIFELQIREILKQWPERKERQRCLVPVDKAVKLLSDAPLIQLVQQIEREVLRSEANVAADRQKTRLSGPTAAAVR